MSHPGTASFPVRAVSCGDMVVLGAMKVLVNPLEEDVTASALAVTCSPKHVVRVCVHPKHQQMCWEANTV